MPLADLMTFTVKPPPHSNPFSSLHILKAGRPVWSSKDAYFYNSGWHHQVTHAQIVLPSKFKDDPEISWMRNRSELWTAAEQAENGSRADVAQAYRMRLPSLSGFEAYRSLVREFSQMLADRYGSAVDTAFRQAGPTTPRTFGHSAQFLLTSREILKSGFGANVPSAHAEAGTIGQLWSEWAKRAEEASPATSTRLQSLAGPIRRRAKEGWERHKEVHNASTDKVLGVDEFIHRCNDRTDHGL